MLIPADATKSGRLTSNDGWLVTNPSGSWYLPPNLNDSLHSNRYNSKSSDSEFWNIGVFIHNT